MSPARARTVTKQAKAYRVYHARKSGSGYGSFSLSDKLDPVKVREVLAPGVSVATVSYRNPQGAAWRKEVSFDDGIIIIPAVPDAASKDLFSGSVVDINWEISRGEGVTVTANGNAHRLRSNLEYKVFGRHLPNASENALILTTMLPCEFNAGGKPNMYNSLIRIDDAGEYGDVEGNSYVNDTLLGYPCFLDDEHPYADYWSFRDALHYLLWVYNPGEKYVKNFDIESISGGDVLPAVNVNGMSLWEAVAALCEVAGYDAFEKFSYDTAAGKIISTIHVVKRHSGNVISVKRQASGQLDFNETNIFSASIAESITSCQTAVRVCGGRDLFEVTVPLYGVWQSDLEIPADSYVVLPSNNTTPNIEAQDYSKRYVVGGSLFPRYADAGRLWDANTDGVYAKAPYLYDIPDMSSLAGQGVGQWPLMRYQPLPMLSGTHDANWQIRSLESFLEVSFDAGETWQQVKGYDVLPDRLGVRLTMENLAGIVKKDGDPATENLFYLLATNADQIAMRLTVTVAGPKKIERTITRGNTARGTAHDVGPVLDRGDLHVRRFRSPKSRFANDSQILADETVYDPKNPNNDPTAVYAAETRYDYNTISQKLENVANEIISALGGKLVEGSLPIEWADFEVGLTDCVSHIDGLNVSLDTTMSNSARYPRVIILERHFGKEQWQTILTLDTNRKAAQI